MKILFVLHGFPKELTGGTERTVEALGVAMVAAGHEVVVVCGSIQPGRPQKVEVDEHRGMRVLRMHRDDLNYESWWKVYHPELSTKMAEIFATERPDVVHVHHWQRLTSDVARLARAAGARVVVSLHDYTSVLARVVRKVDEDEPAPLPDDPWMAPGEAEEEFVAHRQDFAAELAAAQLLLAPSRSHAEGIAQLALTDPGPIEVSAPPLLEVPGRLRHPRNPEGRRLVTWGSVYPEKGLETVLDAMRAANVGWSLTVFGHAHDPAYRKEIENFAAGPDVTFTGPFETAELEAAPADYAVLPTLCMESYGLVVDEALALGLPVIASDVPAYRERLPEASTAFFPPGDAATLTMMLLDPTELQGLAVPEPLASKGAAATAADLLERYETLRVEPFERDVASERQRQTAMFRRAERRLWSTLNSDVLRPPPPEYLR